MLDLLFPPQCLSCGARLQRKQRDAFLCPDCAVTLEKEMLRLCPSCHRSVRSCRCVPEDFLPDGLCSLFLYDEKNGVGRRLILFCKNRCRAAVFRFFGERLASAAARRRLTAPGTLVTYVPRSPEKQAKAGHDQAKELCRCFARSASLPAASVLHHALFAGEQKRKGAEERQNSSRQSYRLLPGAARKVRNRNVLLVDDVVTTGATVNACTALLKEAGARSVVCVTAAKTYLKPNGGSHE